MGPQGWVLSGGSGGQWFPCLFHFLKVARIPWLMAPSFVIKARSCTSLLSDLSFHPYIFSL